MQGLGLLIFKSERFSKTTIGGSIALSCYILQLVAKISSQIQFLLYEVAYKKRNQSDSYEDLSEWY